MTKCECNSLTKLIKSDILSGKKFMSKGTLHRLQGVYHICTAVSYLLHAKEQNNILS